MNLGKLEPAAGVLAYFGQICQGTGVGKERGHRTGQGGREGVCSEEEADSEGGDDSLLGGMTPGEEDVGAGEGVSSGQRGAQDRLGSHTGGWQQPQDSLPGEPAGPLASFIGGFLV